MAVYNTLLPNQMTANSPFSQNYNKYRMAKNPNDLPICFNHPV
jgi:hypothetical protein